METIIQTEYAKHEFDKQTKTLFTKWYLETEKMNDLDFRYEMKEWLNVFRKCKPTYLLDDCADFSYPISPEEQEWMAQLLNATWIALGLKKYAHIVPSELITELSVHQLFYEFFIMNLENQYPIENFVDKQAALEWLYR